MVKKRYNKHSLNKEVLIMSGIGIKAQVTEIKNVSISKQDLYNAALENLSINEGLHIAMQAFKRSVGIHPEAHIENGFWRHQYTVPGPHDTDYNEKLREATPSEIEFYESICSLYQ